MRISCVVLMFSLSQLSFYVTGQRRYVFPSIRKIIQIQLSTEVDAAATEQSVMCAKRSHSPSPGGSNKRPGHWSLGLKQSMSDPKLIVEQDEKVVVIRDKYPKARYHFLVLPKEEISSLKSVNSKHVSLLKHMDKIGREVAERVNKDASFRYGYHAVPSMSQLHLHVISQDFDSPSLKTKKHWNSFTTAYFVDSSDIITQLERKGSIEPISPKEGERLLKQDLRCHKCDFKPPTIPKLKEHLLKHFPK